MRNVILVLGIIAAIARLFLGLGATTNLSDAYPWGMWVSFDILAGVALAGGGFTMAAAIYIFNLKKFEPLLRPAKLSAFIGYLIFVVGLFFDLGQPWRIWPKFGLKALTENSQPPNSSGAARLTANSSSSNGNTVHSASSDSVCRRCPSEPTSKASR